MYWTTTAERNTTWIRKDEQAAYRKHAEAVAVKHGYGAVTWKIADKALTTFFCKAARERQAA